MPLITPSAIIRALSSNDPSCPMVQREVLFGTQAAGLRGGFDQGDLRGTGRGRPSPVSG